MSCEQCDTLKQVVSDLQASERRLGEHIEDLTRELGVVLARERRLKQELIQIMEDDPNAEIITGILKYWKAKTGHPKAKIPMSGARAKITKARLKHFDQNQLRQAIDGAARLPYVGPRGRSATGTPEQRHDDITLIFRDETTVERFIRYSQEDDDAAAPTSIPAGPRPPMRSVSTEPAVDRLLSRLEGVKQEREGQWVARCPAHEDRHASLSVGRGTKGAVVHCHAGCDPTAIAAAAGMDLGELFDPEPDPQPKTTTVAPVRLPSAEQITKWNRRLLEHAGLLDRLREVRGWEPSALTALEIGWDGERLTIPIRDAAGELVSLVRYLPGGKPKSLGARGHRRDLFPAIETLSPDARVWLLEGEPDAVTARQIGLPAVAVPGVNGWRDQWATRFAGRDVVICFDSDTSGREAAERVAVSLLDHVGTVRVVDLVEAADDGFDLSDAVKGGATAPILEEMADTATPLRRLGKAA